MEASSSTAAGVEDMVDDEEEDLRAQPARPLRMPTAFSSESGTSSDEEKPENLRAEDLDRATLRSGFSADRFDEGDAQRFAVNGWTRDYMEDLMERQPVANAPLYFPHDEDSALEALAYAWERLHDAFGSNRSAGLDAQGPPRRRYKEAQAEMSFVADYVQDVCMGQEIGGGTSFYSSLLEVMFFVRWIAIPPFGSMTGNRQVWDVVAGAAGGPDNYIVDIPRSFGSIINDLLNPHSLATERAKPELVGNTVRTIYRFAHDSRFSRKRELGAWLHFHYVQAANAAFEHCMQEASRAVQRSFERFLIALGGAMLSGGAEGELHDDYRVIAHGEAYDEFLRNYRNTIAQNDAAPEGNAVAMAIIREMDPHQLVASLGYKVYRTAIALASAGDPIFAYNGVQRYFSGLVHRMRATRQLFEGNDGLNVECAVNLFFWRVCSLLEVLMTMSTYSLFSRTSEMLSIFRSTINEILASLREILHAAELRVREGVRTGDAPMTRYFLHRSNITKGVIVALCSEYGKDVTDRGVNPVPRVVVRGSDAYHFLMGILDALDAHATDAIVGRLLGPVPSIERDIMGEGRIDRREVKQSLYHDAVDQAKKDLQQIYYSYLSLMGTEEEHDEMVEVLRRYDKVDYLLRKSIDDNDGYKFTIMQYNYVLLPRVGERLVLAFGEVVHKTRPHQLFSALKSYAKMAALANMRLTSIHGKDPRAYAEREAVRASRRHRAVLRRVRRHGTEVARDWRVVSSVMDAFYKVDSSPGVARSEEQRGQVVEALRVVARDFLADVERQSLRVRREIAKDELELRNIKRRIKASMSAENRDNFTRQRDVAAKKLAADKGLLEIITRKRELVRKFLGALTRQGGVRRQYVAFRGVYFEAFERRELLGRRARDLRRQRDFLAARMDGDVLGEMLLYAENVESEEDSPSKVLKNKLALALYFLNPLTLYDDVLKGGDYRRVVLQTADNFTRDWIVYSPTMIDPDIAVSDARSDDNLRRYSYVARLMNRCLVEKSNAAAVATTVSARTLAIGLDSGRGYGLTDYLVRLHHFNADIVYRASDLIYNSVSNIWYDVQRALQTKNFGIEQLFSLSLERFRLSASGGVFDASEDLQRASFAEHMGPEMISRKLGYVVDCRSGLFVHLPEMVIQLGGVKLREERLALPDDGFDTKDIAWRAEMMRRLASEIVRQLTRRREEFNRFCLELMRIVEPAASVVVASGDRDKGVSAFSRNLAYSFLAHADKKHGSGAIYIVGRFVIQLPEWATKVPFLKTFDARGDLEAMNGVGEKTEVKFVFGDGGNVFVNGGVWCDEMLRDMYDESEDYSDDEDEDAPKNETVRAPRFISARVAAELFDGNARALYVDYVEDVSRAMYETTHYAVHLKRHYGTISDRVLFIVGSAAAGDKCVPFPVTKDLEFVRDAQRRKKRLFLDPYASIYVENYAPIYDKLARELKTRSGYSKWILNHSMNNGLFFDDRYKRDTVLQGMMIPILKTSADFIDSIVGTPAGADPSRTVYPWSEELARATADATDALERFIADNSPGGNVGWFRASGYFQSFLLATLRIMKHVSALVGRLHDIEHRVRVVLYRSRIYSERPTAQSLLSSQEAEFLADFSRRLSSAINRFYVEKGNMEQSVYSDLLFRESVGQDVSVLIPPERFHAVYGRVSGIMTYLSGRIIRMVASCSYRIGGYAVCKKRMHAAEYYPYFVAERVLRFAYFDEDLPSESGNNRASTLYDRDRYMVYQELADEGQDEGQDDVLPIYLFSPDWIDEYIKSSTEELSSIFQVHLLEETSADDDEDGGNRHFFLPGLRRVTTEQFHNYLAASNIELYRDLESRVRFAMANTLGYNLTHALRYYFANGGSSQLFVRSEEFLRRAAMQFDRLLGSNFVANAQRHVVDFLRARPFDTSGGEGRRSMLDSVLMRSADYLDEAITSVPGRGVDGVWKSLMSLSMTHPVFGLGILSYRSVLVAIERDKMLLAVMVFNLLNDIRFKSILPRILRSVDARYRQRRAPQGGRLMIPFRVRGSVLGASESGSAQSSGGSLLALERTDDLRFGRLRFVNWSVQEFLDYGPNRPALSGAIVRLADDDVYKPAADQSVSPAAYSNNREVSSAVERIFAARQERDVNPSLQRDGVVRTLMGNVAADWSKYARAKKC